MSELERNLEIIQEEAHGLRDGAYHERGKGEAISRALMAIHEILSDLAKQQKA